MGSFVHQSKCLEIQRPNRTLPRVPPENDGTGQFADVPAHVNATTLRSPVTQLPGAQLAEPIIIVQALQAQDKCITHCAICEDLPGASQPSDQGEDAYSLRSEVQRFLSPAFIPKLLFKACLMTSETVGAVGVRRA